MLIGDPNRLRQIFMNLIGNAIKFTKKGEIVASARVEESFEDEVLLHLAVCDTGIGIPPEVQQRIFEAFEQADGSTTRKYGGTGLGLAISTHLVKMMCGRIWVESEVDVGSTFHFTVRLRLSHKPMARPAKLDIENLQGLPVLIVDDNATNRRILQETLSGWKMQPAIAESGSAALDAVRQATGDKMPPFKLVLLDCQMPEMDGIVLVEHIRRDPNMTEAAIIVLTSTLDNKLSARCRELNLSACLTKPVIQSDLLDAIAAWFADKTRPQKNVTKQPAATIEENRRELNILLTDDNGVNRKLGAKMLERQGHRVVVAESGKQALEIYEKESFDLILMEMQMPEMNGFETTSAIRLREQQVGKRTPILAMTARAMKGNREEYIAAGMDEHISKPLRTDELFAVVERLFPNITTSEIESPTVDAP
jgi:CheY-like chemotaxis protein